ncbi:hypothetical protein [Actinokineospora pegani]|uniref:hypothetical protein n=1 Tax=Actinokineospora pegani TaxID=2654637 RepID=UPI0012EAB81C|nr:hypothetical protein [Actinokineospora pegani]
MYGQQDPEPAAVDPADGPTITSRQDAAQALVRYFLANADANNHEANDDLVQELRRRAPRSLPAQRRDDL